MFTAAKSGVSATRVFHQAAKLPCGSVSTTATGPAPASSASTAKCALSVVFPVPPFCDAMVRTCICAPQDIRFYVNEGTRQCVSIAYIHPYPLVVLLLIAFFLPALKCTCRPPASINGLLPGKRFTN